MGLGPEPTIIDFSYQNRNLEINGSHPTIALDGQAAEPAYEGTAFKIDSPAFSELPPSRREAEPRRPDLRTRSRRQPPTVVGLSTDRGGIPSGEGVEQYELEDYVKVEHKQVRAAREELRQVKRDEKRRWLDEQDEMKFSHSIQFNAVPDWSSHYIAYSNLKKM